MSPAGNTDSPSERNKWPIFNALAPWLGQARRVLEIGAGDATHARHALTQLPEVIWQTSEAPGHLRRLRAAFVDSNETRLPVPIALDVRSRWPDMSFDAVYGANIAHIMDWAAVQALFAGTGRHLENGGLLCLYGPFVSADITPEPSNATFDASLRARDPAMGLRELGELDALGRTHGLKRMADIAMPANNRLLIWRRA